MSRSTLMMRLLAVLLLAFSAPVWGADGKTDKEKQLLGVLRSDAAPAEKALVCKHLAVHGSEDAVPDLAALLPNEQLSSWARIALEAIPGAAADEALRNAAKGLNGKLLVGVLNSIGVRKDLGAAELLTGKIDDGDSDVASAAALALGRLKTPAAAATLKDKLTKVPAAVRSTVAEGCILCAEQLASEGKNQEAAELYDAVRKSEVPKQRKLEATRGAILAGGANAVPLLLEQLRSDDRHFFALGLSTARELAGKDVDLALAEEISKAKPERAALIVTAMADRRGSADLGPILSVASKGEKSIRLAALVALKQVGNETCLATLVDGAQEPDAELAKAARETIAALPGDKVNPAILDLLKKAEGKQLQILLGAVAARRIDATGEVLKAVDSADKSVRAAALAALGETVDLTKLPLLINLAVRPKNKEDALAAQAALKAASVRMPDREACAAQLTEAFEKASPATKGVLLQTLAAVGGTKALDTMVLAARGTDANLQDISTKHLGEWMTADAAPKLLDLSKSAPGEKFQLRALRGYIRIARQFVLPEAERMEMCQKAYDAAKATSEKKLVLDVLKRYPTVAGLKMAVTAAGTTDLKEDGQSAALAIAGKLKVSPDEVKELIAKLELGKVKLEIVKATYGAGATQKDVTEVVQKQTKDLPMITLGSDNYNAAFGGDPIPGMVKQLKIQYKINGKAGEASFAENALIILPMPK